MLTDSMKLKLIDFQIASQGKSEDARMWDIVGPV
jgi:hypothetical protein